ncbi:sugar ABC transporter substrate-binding protein [Amycolatopsis sp. NPDC047767]|uniref:sugar ABC transporter substrate-binding protein n=1 Tax=Amycolatopsis sp. NPDC047767 TaxID=3156765 RepID=UPI003454A0FD
MRLNEEPARTSERHPHRRGATPQRAKGLSAMPTITPPKSRPATRPRSRLIAAAIIGSLAAVSLAACGSSSSAGSSDSGASGGSSSGAVAFFTDGLGNSYLQSATNAAKALAAKDGVKMDVFSADFDSGKQLTQIQDAVSSGKYKALVVEAIDGQSVCRALTDAAQHLIVSIYNTPICGHVQDLYSPGTIGFFGRLESETGRLFAGYMHKALPNGGKVAYLPGPAGSSIVQLTTQNFLDELKKYPGLDLVATVPGNWDGATGLAATQDIVQAHPDVNGIVFGDDNTATPSMKWLIDTGKLGNIKVVSLAGAANVVDMVKAGQVYADVAGLPVEEATRALQAAIQTMQGEKITVPGFDPTTKVYNVLKDPMFHGGDPVITKANAAGFTSTWSVG